MDVHKESISIAVRNDAGKIVMECVIETKGHLDESWSVYYGPHPLGRYHSDGIACNVANTANFSEEAKPAPPAGLASSFAGKPVDGDKQPGQIIC
ncbi:MAG TPA: hypothetical protein VN982_16385 [Candidatus Dormibacteraeota bacterium]|nr:hypothetical protein [Candidatus Dormibacteraeota bacterium]